MQARVLNRLGEANPQLFRELKGRLKPRNLAIASAMSVVGQVVLFLYYQSLLPDREDFSRYCTGSHLEYASPHASCVRDLLGNVMVLKNLWWLDLFIGLSFIGIFALLVVGTHLLIADLSQEEHRGTLNFLRLSPQSPGSILLGKLLGVPLLLYWVVGLALPLHLGAGIAAGIPLGLILSFYGIVIASCACFYSAALLYGLVASSLGGFQAWLGSGAMLLFLSVTTGLTLEAPLVRNLLDWLRLLHPGAMLVYLVNATFLPERTVNYLSPQDLSGLLWYGQSLWSQASVGMSLVILNYCLWTYWFWQGLRRRFRNPLSTALSKPQSYWLSGCFIVTTLGFTLQGRDYQLATNFQVQLFFNWLLFMVLIAALSPHRQTLQDWARYRHQTPKFHRSLMKELIWGEKSPSTVAIALNLVVVTAYTLPSIVLFPLGAEKSSVLVGLLLGANIILVYAAIAQALLMMKTPKRSLWAVMTVGALSLVPMASCALLGVHWTSASWLLLFSPLPALAVKQVAVTVIGLSCLGQWLVIVLASAQISRQLQKAGQSETQALSASITSKQV